ncbi:MAG TPA: DoxX family protein [Candidatus Binatia bacterium]|jgi:uncharacterized membrane protein YphA (DoxX/SURF4 family)|nr:DoxX family protein [Candidatus Binatia bacterium]
MNVALWIVQVLLAAEFLFSGVMKFITPIEEMTKQMPLPAWFLYFIGAAEVLGGLGLILPGIFGTNTYLTPIAAAGLAVIMIGACVVTLMIGGGALVLIPLVTGLLAAFVAYGRRRLAPLAALRSA